MVESVNVPPQDRFQIITEHKANDLIFDPDYLGITRSDDIVRVQITFSAETKPPQKRKLFSAWLRFCLRILDSIPKIS